MSKPVVIIGAGGHAKVVADALLAAGQEVVGFLDPDASLHGGRFCGLPVLGDEDLLETYFAEDVHLANGIGSVGRGSLRQIVQQKLKTRGWEFIGVRHPAALISPFVTTGRDLQALAGCIIQVDAMIGTGCIVNTAAVVEHDVSLSDWVTVAPGAIICGGVKVGRGSFIGAGAILRQGVEIGAATLVAAGAVVVNCFPGGGVIAGCPARPQERLL